MVVYVAELIALPVSIDTTPAKSGCCGGGKAANTAPPSCKRHSRGKQQLPCSKQQKDCNSANGCLNCPLCYAVTMPATVVSGKPLGKVKTEYPVFRSNYGFIYYSIAWKPPNGC